MNPIRRRLLAALPAAALASAVPPSLCFAQGADVAAALARWPHDGRVAYRILLGERGLLVGRTVHAWQHDGQRYRLTSVSESEGVAALFASGQARQESIDSIGADGLQPESFRHVARRHDDRADFDWSARTVRYRERVEPLAPGTQDLLSMYYQLALRRAPGGALTMPIATGRKQAVYAFVFVGRETLTVGAATHAVEHVRVTQGEQQFDFWVTPLAAGEGSPLPLRMRVRERNGQVFDQVLDLAAH